MTTSNLFDTTRPIVGMIHLLALPETPAYQNNLNEIYERALREAVTLHEAGVDALIVENFGDEPYMPGELSPVQLALMAGVTRDIKHAVDLPIGVNCQFNAWQSEVAVAFACQADFIRVEVFVEAVSTAQGHVMPCSAQILRYRQRLDAKNIGLWADIQAKYTRNLLPQTMEQSAVDAQAAGADMLIVTGSGTGQTTPLDVVARVKGVVHIPVIIGSGATAANVSQALRVADGAIVGSAFKVDGKAENEVSAEAARAFMESIGNGRK